MGAPTSPRGLLCTVGMWNGCCCNLPVSTQSDSKKPLPHCTATPSASCYTLPYRSPTITSLVQSRLVIAAASFLFPSYRALQSVPVPVPVLLPVPDFCVRHCACSLTHDPTRLVTTTIIPYCAVLCCASCSGLLSHQTAPICNATHGRPTPRHVDPAVPVSLLQGCSKQHHAARHTTTHQDCHVRCHPVLPLAKPSAGVSLATRHHAPQLARDRLLGRQQSPRSDRPSCPAQPISGFS